MVRCLVALGLILAACGGKVVDENVATRTVGTQKGDPNAPATTSDPGPVLTATPGGGGCVAAVPFSAKFDQGIGAGFDVADASAFTVEDHSLRVVPSAQSALTRAIGGACQLRVSLSMRASVPFQKDGGAILRIEAGSRRFALVATGGAFAIDEEVDAVSSNDFVAGDPFGAVTTDAQTIMLTFDLTEHLISASTKPLVGKGVAATFKMTVPNGRLSGAERIASVSLGASLAADYVSPKPGDIYWIDGFSLQ